MQGRAQDIQQVQLRYEGVAKQVRVYEEQCKTIEAKFEQQLSAISQKDEQIGWFQQFKRQADLNDERQREQIA